jgi:adenylate kinase
VVVHLDVREQDLRRRLLARAELEGRADDTPDVIARRLRVYVDATAPLIVLYRERGQLVEIDGEQAVEAITD